MHSSPSMCSILNAAAQLTMNTASPVVCHMCAACNESGLDHCASRLVCWPQLSCKTSLRSVQLCEWLQIKHRCTGVRTP